MGGIWTPDLYLTKVTRELSLPSPNQDNDNNSRVDLGAVEVAGSDSSFNWLDFEEFLLHNCNRNTAKIRLFYAKKFVDVLMNQDREDIQKMLFEISSPDKRLNMMKSITLLAKYFGCYDSWQETRKRYNLRWSKGDTTASFRRFFDPSLDFDAMLSKVKVMINRLPQNMAALVRHACLTGLRPHEAVESVRLLNSISFLPDNGRDYYNVDTQALEHFKYPEIFIRRTKKAYVSYITKEQLSQIGVLGCKTPTPTYLSIRMACYHRSIKMNLRYCRKIHASWLYQCGLSPVYIDMLQGRTSKSILAQHYLTPAHEEIKIKVLHAVSELSDKLN